MKLIVSKTQLSDSGDSSRELSKEKFSSQFEQAKKIPAKKCIKEQSYENKKLARLEKSQRKMTEFFQDKTDVVLTIQINTVNP